jgi:nitroimidazol reductase NimA-like FMN-containing flavoprotein (pyridoxamine 5'-phosphate oxidase superfamily)
VGRKGAILSQNNRVSFEVDRFSDTLDEYASVLIEGRLIEVTDLGEKSRVKSINDGKYTRLRRGNRPGHGRSTPLGSLPMRKIVVESLSGRKKEAAPVAALQFAH